MKITSGKIGIGPLLAALLLSAPLGCGGRQGPTQGNYIEPVMLEGCASAIGELPADQRSLAAMVAALHAARFQIHQVSPVEFQVYTEFRELRGGITAAWAAQIYSDGSAQLSLPETMPMQDARALDYLRRLGQKIGRYFDKYKCAPVDRLRTASAKGGYPF
jgi:hypothetical protein